MGCDYRTSQLDRLFQLFQLFGYEVKIILRGGGGRGGGTHTHCVHTPPSHTHTHTCMQTTTNATMGTETRLSKRRRRKRERLEDDRAHAKEMTEFRLAQYIASGRAGRCFREPRDDLSVYGAIFGPEKEPIVKGPILWWKQHQWMMYWLPMRRRGARTRHWRAWQCYAFPCAACGFPNCNDSPPTHERNYPIFNWQDGRKDSALLRCGGCGAGVFDMVSP